MNTLLPRHPRSPVCPCPQGDRRKGLTALRHSMTRISAGPSDERPCPKFAGVFSSLCFCAPTRSPVPFGMDSRFRDLLLFKHALGLFVCCTIYHAIKTFWNISTKTLSQCPCYLPKDSRAFQVLLGSSAPSTSRHQPRHPGLGLTTLSQEVLSWPKPFS